MSEATSVQFETVEDAVWGYRAAKIPKFAIWHKKELQIGWCPGDADIDDGAEFLTQWLNVLSKGGTIAIYSIRLYKNLEDGDDIDSNTPYNSSFNFRLNKYAKSYLPPEVYQQYGGGNAHTMFEELQKVRTELKMLQEKVSEEGESEEEEKTAGERIQGVLLEGLEGTIQGIMPMIATSLGNRIGDWLSPPAARTATISGITLDDTDSEAWTKTHEPLNLLMKADPEFPMVLQQLARLQEKRALQYNMYKAALLKMRF